ncbi:hypothetical protein E4U16_000384 [Claviceps sp. LM84 group G4]|nr:hypothetical protein E4U16_000384 [Claviceps sp. LM84 group G4]
MASPAASRYGVDDNNNNNNNNHSAIAAVFAESRATAAASPWAAPAAPIAGFYKGLNRASRRRCIIFKAIIRHMLLGRLTIDLTSNIMGGKVQRQIGRAISLMRNL